MIIIQHFTNPLCDKVALPPLQRAAILTSGFAPAQYKLDHASEFTQLPARGLPSVQHCSLMSQQTEIEADMALSTQLLCVAEESFEKDVRGERGHGGYLCGADVVYTSE